MKRASKTPSAAKVIQYWQNKNNTHEVDYKAITKFTIDNNLLPVRPITVEEQIEAALRQAVKSATWKNPKGHKVRLYGIPRFFVNGELFTDSPVDMRYVKPDIAKIVQDANYEGIGNDVKRHSIETESYSDNNPYGAKLPFYDYDFNQQAQEARQSGTYDDKFDESELDDDKDEDSE